MESKKSDVKEALGSSSLLRNILVVLMAAIFLSIVAYSWMFPSVSSDPTRWAQFGDFFGGIFNPLISLAALVGLFVVIKLTVETLSVGRETLRVTREEQEQNRVALKEQMVEKQFFDLVGAFLDLRKSVFHPKSGQHGVGALLAYFHPVLGRLWDREINAGTAGEVKRTFDGFYKAYLSERKSFSAVFNTFELLVINAYKIDGADEDPSQFHKSLLVALLTDEEKMLFSIYARSTHSKFSRGSDVWPFCEAWLLSNFRGVEFDRFFGFFEELKKLQH